jgi:hypothetical protein
MWLGFLPTKRGFIDHTQYNTLSILKTIEDRFGLEPLSALDDQANSLKNSLSTE